MAEDRKEKEKKKTKRSAAEAGGKSAKPAPAQPKPSKSTETAAKPETTAKPETAAKPEATSRKVPVVRARAKYLRSPARKTRLVADHIRGRSVDEARAILQFSPRAVARELEKLLDSAVANAENNHDLVGDELRISALLVDEGPTLKRYRPRAMGRATPIMKRTCHVSLSLTPLSSGRGRN